MRWLLVALMVTGCAAKTWMPIAATSLAMTATACDWHQTHDTAQSSRRMEPNWEANPVLGGDPDVSKVDSYFATVGSAEMVAGAAITALPGKWRWLGVATMLAVAGFEVETAYRNVGVGQTVGCY